MQRRDQLSSPAIAWKLSKCPILPKSRSPKDQAEHLTGSLLNHVEPQVLAKACRMPLPAAHCSMLQAKAWKEAPREEDRQAWTGSPTSQYRHAWTRTSSAGSPELFHRCQSIVLSQVQELLHVFGLSLQLG